MPSGPNWVFIQDGNRTWTWTRNPDSDAPLTSIHHVTLQVAIDDAVANALVVNKHQWKATTAGRTTYFRPGIGAVNLPSASTRHSLSLALTRPELALDADGESRFSLAFG